MSEQAAVPDEVTVQAALPSFELPEFEGLHPVGVVTKVNGAGQRIQRPMHLEERVIIVAECEVSNVGHGTTNDGIKRVHTLAVRDLYELEGKAGAKLLRSLRSAYRMADDARHGRRRLDVANTDDHVGVEVKTDGSGVVMTPGERGSLAGLGLPDVETFVFVFDDERRALWPDEFEDGPAAVGVTRPGAGEQIRFDGEDRLLRQVLDGDTGETLEEWTDEDEDARLAELERQAAEAERTGDREALAEIEKGRGRCGEIFDGGKICAREIGHPAEHVAAAGGPGDFAESGNVVSGPFSEPWPDFESCTVADVEAALSEETDIDKVFAVAAYEERHGARKGVLKAVACRAAELGAGE